GAEEDSRADEQDEPAAAPQREAGKPWTQRDPVDGGRGNGPVRDLLVGSREEAGVDELAAAVAEDVDRHAPQRDALQRGEGAGQGALGRLGRAVEDVGPTSLDHGQDVAGAVPVE